MEESASAQHSTATDKDIASIASGLSALSTGSNTSKSAWSGVSTRSRNGNPLWTNARSIAEPVPREILEDLESNGGVQGVLSASSGLTEFCEARVQEGKEAVHGSFRTNLREKTSKKSKVGAVYQGKSVAMSSCTVASLRLICAKTFVRIGILRVWFLFRKHHKLQGQEHLEQHPSPG